MILGWNCIRKVRNTIFLRHNNTIGKEWDGIIGDSVSTLTSERDVILYVNHLPSKMGKVNSVDLHIAPNSFLDSFYLEPGTPLRFTFEGKHYELKTKERFSRNMVVNLMRESFS